MISMMTTPVQWLQIEKLEEIKITIYRYVEKQGSFIIKHRRSGQAQELTPGVLVFLFCIFVRKNPFLIFSVE